MSGDVFSRLREAILNYDEDAAESLANDLASSGGDCIEGIKSMTAAMVELGEQFQAREVFLPEVLMASDAMKKALPILRRGIIEQGKIPPRLGKVVAGTVRGDIHAVGKDLVVMMLTIAGFEVVDLGEDVAPSQFISTALEQNADIIALSALMTTTMPAQRDVIEFLKAKGVRHKYKVLVGGGVVRQEWADLIGADGYAQDAMEAVNLARKVLGMQSSGINLSR